MVETTERCEHKGGHFRAAALAVLMMVASLAMLTPQGAEAKMAQTGNCLNCHNEKNSTATTSFALNGVEQTLTPASGQPYNHTASISVSSGATFEIDYIVDGLVRNNSSNIAIIFEPGSTWGTNGGTFPSVANTGTNNSPALTNWNTVWDGGHAQMIGWNEPVRAPGGSEPTGMGGDLYTKNWAGTAWDEGNADTAENSAAAADLDGVAARMGSDVRLTAPTTGGPYVIYLVGVGSGDLGNKGYAATQVTISITGGGDTTPPADIADLATGTVTSSSVQLSWTAPGDDGSIGTATSYDVRYSTAGAITNANWASATPATGEPAPSIAGTPESFKVTGLSASTQYWFAIKTSDEVPNTAVNVSNSPTATTSAAADSTPPADIADLATGAVTSSSVDLTWTAPGDDGSTGTATSYDVRYSTAGAITNANWASATPATGEPAPSIAGTPESFTVTGLSASTQYWFAIKASDEVPNTAVNVSNSPTATTSAAAVNTTAAGTASAAPGNAVIDVTAPYSDDDNADNTVTIEWDVQGGTWSGPDYGTNTLVHAASPYTYQIAGLTNGQPYQVRVTYNDADGVTGTSPQVISNITPIATDPMLHNSINTGSGKWGGWGIPGGRYGEFTCATCHTRSTTNIKRVKTSVVSPNSPTHNFPGSAVTFLSAVDGSSDFGDDGTTHASSTKVCEACHTYDATQANGVKQHAYNMSVTTNHYNNKDCMACHKHNQGFKANNDCNGCHGYPPTAGDGFGYQAVEGKGAHLKHVQHLEARSGLTRNPTADSFGDATVTALCGVCHDMNGAAHETGGGTRNINFNGSTAYQFGAAASLYNGAIGSPSSTTPKNCSNVSCHFKTTPVWE